jgi:hypothetical protein
MASTFYFLSHIRNTYLLKARIVEQEKQPLLANGSETTFVSRQRPRNKGTTYVARQQILNEQE